MCTLHNQVLLSGHTCRDPTKGGYFCQIWLCTTGSGQRIQNSFMLVPLHTHTIIGGTNILVLYCQINIETLLYKNKCTSCFAAEVIPTWGAMVEWWYFTNTKFTINCVASADIDEHIIKISKANTLWGDLREILLQWGNSN